MKLFNQYTITKLIIVFSCIVQSQTINKDSLKISNLKRHISTIDYISRQTNNNKYYIQLGQTYTDSILSIDPKNSYAEKFNDKFNLTLSTCDQNMNHKVELFPFFEGFPEYMGFADDPIEYAYDDALAKLFSLRYLKLSKSPIKDENITSIIVRKNCDDEMFEIVNQTVIENTNHYILPPHEITSLIGDENYQKLIDGDLSDDLILPITEKLNIERLGIFIVNDIDVIDNKIWFVESKFTTYDRNSGLNEPIFSKGFCHDKRAIGILQILIILIESILLLTFLSFLTTYSFRNKFNSKNILSNFSFGFIYKLEFVSKVFIIPLVFSFVMIYSLSYIMPSPEDHYMEFSAKIWVLLLTIGMSLVPTIINLYVINRMDLDGFHTINGYRTFANTSLYATYLPLEIFYLIQNDVKCLEAQFISIFVTFCIGDLLARSYFQFTAISKNSSLKTQSFIGLILGIVCLLIFNLLILTKLSIHNLLYSIALIVPLCLLHRQIGVYLNRKYEQMIRSSSEIKFLSDIPFIESLIDPQRSIFSKVNESMSNNELNIFTISGPSGIGKTRSLFETKYSFEENGWEWYYGDCDEVQGETAISFEPFLEAFKNLLKIEEFTNRGEQLESLMGSAVEIGAAIIDVDTSSFVNNYDRDGNQKMTEICVDIIEKLEKRKKKTVFVMEDIHWIDPESYSFLKLFIQMINRNKFLRGNICIIFSMRCETDNKFRGPNSDEFKNDLKEIQNNSSFKFSIQDLLNENDFNVRDFAKQLSIQNNNFKIQNNSLVQINDLFNNAIDEYVVDYITPLYITKVIEKWIEEELLIYSPEGYRLSSAISSENLPNDTGVDSYYHAIISNYDEKWQRLLESAAIIGNKFNAEILASVWRYELLDVLSFLEKAVQDKLLIDISEEDNIYMFGVKSKVGSGKRIISSIKSYFTSYDTDESEKQITLEYNKRYIDLQHDIIANTHDYSVEEILKTLRRLCTLLINNNYRLKAEKLIFELVVRLVDKHEIEKLKSVQSFLDGYNAFKTSVQVIDNIIYIIDTDGPKNKLKTIENKLYNQNYEKGSLDYNLRIYALLPHDGKVDICDYYLVEEELNYIENELLSDFDGYVKVCLSLLYSDQKWKMNNELVDKDEIFDFYSKKINFLEDLISNISDIESYLDIEINLWKLNLLINQAHLNPSKADLDVLDKKSIKILEKVKVSKQSRHILSNAYTTRFKVLSTVFRNDERTIQEFRDNLILSDQFKDINWVKSVLSFLNSWSADIYFKQHSDEGITLLNQCEEVIYKYVDDTVWTSTIDFLLCAKNSYYLSVEDYTSALEVNFKNLDFIVSNINDNNFYYEDACSSISNVYEKMGDGENSIKWDLKSIKVLEDMNPSPKTKKMLSVAYSNISQLYRNLLNDPENCLKYAKMSLELKNPAQEKSYGISLYSLARAYDFSGHTKQAIEYFKKADPFFPESTTKDIYHKNVLKLNLGISYHSIDKKEAMKILKDVVKDLKTDRFKNYISTNIKNRISDAEKLF
jgi:hypothetical protein